MFILVVVAALAGTETRAWCLDRGGVHLVEKHMQLAACHSSETPAERAGCRCGGAALSGEGDSCLNVFLPSVTPGIYRGTSKNYFVTTSLPPFLPARGNVQAQTTPAGPWSFPPQAVISPSRSFLRSVVLLI